MGSVGAIPSRIGLKSPDFRQTTFLFGGGTKVFSQSGSRTDSFSSFSVPNSIWTHFLASSSQGPDEGCPSAPNLIPSSADRHADPP